jgi:hypothetical protein
MAAIYAELAYEEWVWREEIEAWKAGKREPEYIYVQTRNGYDV